MRPDIVDPKPVWATSLWLWLGITILVISFAVGFREYREAQALNRIKFERAVDSSASTLRISLRMRESITEAAAAAYRPAALPFDGELETIDERLLDYIGNVYSFVWAPLITPADQASAVPALAENAGRPVQLFGGQRRSLTLAEQSKPLVVIADIIPRTYANRSSIGLALNSMPIPSAALADARKSGRVTATAPLSLVQLPGEKSVVLYAPVRDQRSLIGYIGISYRVKDLLGGVQESGPIGLLRISDVGPGTGGGLLFESDSWAPMRAASTRQVKFGGRIWEVAYARPERDDAAIQRGFAAGMAAMLLLLAIVGIALYLIDRNRRLQQALIAHGEAEEQLKIIAGELAHRVKNAYMVALALASQTLERDDQEGLRSFSGRMRALAKAADGLTDGRQQAASLRAVLEAELPASDQIACNGPDISMPADAVQNIHLMFHELATNAAKHGALATADGRVRVDWQLIDGSVNLVWQEVCASAPADLPSQKGFGRSLLETMVPEQLHGTGELSMTAEGLRYAIRFPFPHPVP